MGQLIRRVCRAALAGSLILVGGGEPAAAAPIPELAVMSLRAAVGSISFGTFREANNLLWQKMMAVPDLRPLTEAQIADRVGSEAYGRLKSCRKDTCMLELAQRSGVQRLIWGWLAPSDQGGFRLEIHAIDPRRGRVHREAPGCEPCSEAEFLAVLVDWAPDDAADAAYRPPAGGGNQVNTASASATTRETGTAPFGWGPSAAEPWQPRAGRSISPGAAVLKLRVTPAGARVFVNDRSLGAIPEQGLRLAPGRHRVRVEHAGYLAQSFELLVESGDELTRMLSLRRVRGLVDVSSNPLGATVLVDGRVVGTTPLKQLRLAAGVHQIRVDLSRHQVQERTLRVTGGKRSSLRFRLTPAFGRLGVTSRPAGATVRVDGAEAGITPLKALELDLGVHHIELLKAGFAPRGQSVEIDPLRATHLSLELRPSHGNLSVTATPEGAHVYLDGRPVGVAPLSNLSIAAGDYVVEVRAERFGSVRSKTRIRGGRNSRINVALEPLYGVLDVETRPSGAQVLVDGRALGVTRLRGIELPKGHHELRLRREGYQDVLRVVEIRGGQLRRISMRLRATVRSVGKVSLRSTPPGARVLAGTRDLGMTPREIELEAGTHVLRWILPGYELAQRKVVIRAGRRHHFDSRLKLSKPPPGMGAVTVLASPKEAEILIGGRSLAQGTLRDHLLLVGAYSLTLRLKGYEDLDIDLTVRDGKRQTIKRSLRRQRPADPDGFLTVTSAPPGARIRANGVELGETPVARYPLQPGHYLLDASLKHYGSLEREISVRSRRPLKVDFKLKTRHGVLAVQTVPAGATVFLDGRELGSSPGRWTGLRPGKHSVLVSKPGHLEELRQIELRPGREQSMLVRLGAAPGLLTVKTVPSGARIEIDGEPRGTTPLRGLELPPGEHRLKVSLSGYQVAEGKVTLRSKIRRELLFELQADEDRALPSVRTPSLRRQRGAETP